MMKATGSCRARAAVHSPWIEYMAEPSPIRPITLRPGRASATPTAAGRPMAETAAGAGVEAVALDHRQMILHRPAAARRFLDDDAACRAAARRSAASDSGRSAGRRACGAAAVSAPAARCERGGGGCSSSAAIPSFRLVTMEARPGPRRRRPDRRSAASELAPGRNVRPLAFDVVGEYRSAEHQDQIGARAAAATIEARSAGRKPANSGCRSGKLLRADIGLTHTAA